MAEQISLDLDAERAALLILIIDQAIDVLTEKNKVIQEIVKLPINEWPKDMKIETLKEGLHDTEHLIKGAKELAIEVQEIFQELNSDDFKPRPLIINKPIF